MLHPCTGCGPLRFLFAAALLLPLASVASAQKEVRNPPPSPCLKGELPDPKTGKCVQQVVCRPDQEVVLNKCFPKCPEGMKIDNQGKCQGCPTGQLPDPKGTGKCVQQVVCGPDQEVVRNKCFAKCPDGSKRTYQGKCPKPALERR